MFVYSIYDKKAICHKSMFFAASDAEAVRSISRAANDTRTDLCMFPSDFALYCLGECDINTGALSGFTPVKIVCEVSALIKVDNVAGTN